MTPPRTRKPEPPSVYQLCLAYSRGALRRHELLSALRKDDLTQLGKAELLRARDDGLLDESTYAEALRPLDW